MAWDAARQRVVLFGGRANGPDFYLYDTWEWDGATWTLRNLAASPPPEPGALAWDGARQRMMLFNGSGTWVLLP